MYIDSVVIQVQCQKKLLVSSLCALQIDLPKMLCVGFVMSAILEIVLYLNTPIPYTTFLDFITFVLEAACLHNPDL